MPLTTTRSLRPFCPFARTPADVAMDVTTALINTNRGNMIGTARLCELTNERKVNAGDRLHILGGGISTPTEPW